MMLIEPIDHDVPESHELLLLYKILLLGFVFLATKGQLSADTLTPCYFKYHLPSQVFLISIFTDDISPPLSVYHNSVMLLR